MSSWDLEPFFLLCEPEPNPCLADIDPENPYQSEKIVCPIFPGHRRPGRRLSPLNIIVPCQSPPDVVFTWMSAILIQDRVKEIFGGEQLTGFATRPAVAKLRKTAAAVPVSELVVVGWGGTAQAASGIREVGRCAGCGHLTYSGLEEPSVLINPKNWDGSDFFVIWPLPMFRFVTQKVVDVCKKHHITGVTFERNFPSSAGGGFSPGRLSYYMPVQRAHELGEELGIE